MFVAGASGFVGTALVPRLRAAGYEVRAGMRQPRAMTGVESVRFDLDEEGSIDAAVAGCDAVVYLVHGLDRPGFASWEQATAERFARACRRAAVDRLVYLGGVVPTRRTFLGRTATVPSAHLQSRLATGAALRDAAPGSLELRAGVVVGAGGASFRMLRDVAARSPVIVRAPWLAAEQQPIALDDVCAAIVHAVGDDSLTGALDVPGPTTLTSEALLRLVAALLGNRVVFVDAAVDPSLIARGIVRLTRADAAVIHAILDGADGADYVAKDDGIYAVCPGLPRTPLKVAVRQALVGEEQSLDLTDIVVEALAHRVFRARVSP